MKTIFVSVATPTTWPNLLVLWESISKFNPDTDLEVVYLGENPPTHSSIQVNQYLDFNFDFQTYTQREIERMAGVYLVKKMIEAHDEVIFLQAHSVLQRKLTFSGDFDIGLVSQWKTDIEADGCLPDAKYHLNYGTFNADFWVVRRTHNTLRFLEWWSKNLQTRGYYDTENGLAGDQLWLDLVPVFFDKVQILDDTYFISLHQNTKITNFFILNFNGMKPNGTPIDFLSNRPMSRDFSIATKSYFSKLLAPLPDLPIGIQNPQNSASIVRKKIAIQVKKIIAFIESYQPEWAFKQPKK